MATHIFSSSESEVDAARSAVESGPEADTTAGMGPMLLSSPVKPTAAEEESFVDPSILSPPKTGIEDDMADVQFADDVVDGEQSQSEPDEEFDSASESEEEEETVSEPTDSEEEETRKRRPRKTGDVSRAAPSTPSSRVSEKTAEARRDFDEALAKVSKPSVRTASSGAVGVSESVEWDDEAIQLRERMQALLDRDIRSLASGKPALERLRFLPLVLETMNRVHMQEILLENGFLTAVRQWLEPLPIPRDDGEGCDDGGGREGEEGVTAYTLPGANLRLPLLEALRQLPIETSHLRESGLGRIVYFFAKRPGELEQVRAVSTALVDSWSQPIIQSDRAHRRKNGDEEDERGEDDYAMERPQSGPGMVMSSEALKRRPHPPSPSRASGSAATGTALLQRLQKGKGGKRRL